MNRDLEQIVIARIQSKGPISFRDFMEMALYYPGIGYYTSSTDKIGCNGDFYTSSNVSPIYGEMIGRQMEEMWALLGYGPFTIAEVGAGTGKLCYDVLCYLKRNKALSAALNYCIVERSEPMRERERSLVGDDVTWYKSVADLPEMTGCIFSNELIDNFAVHQVVMKQELMEVFVDHDNGFKEVLLPATGELKAYFDELGVKLQPDFRAEVNLEAVDWIGTVATRLKKGYVLTIDYGYPSSELYKEHRREGTIVCYNHHSVNNEPYSEIGGQDITSHVNFSSLHHWGEKHGLQLCGYTNQAFFLLSLGIAEELANKLVHTAEDGYAGYRQNSHIIQRLLIEMGPKFKVLIQSKNLPQAQLSGLKLAQPYQL
ncbi:MAG: SAM-dependent methyltransferase [Taibaiella sp.]|nr:SAM-dependent methyltransferase [Taibaiella sp.]